MPARVDGPPFSCAPAVDNLTGGNLRAIGVGGLRVLDPLNSTTAMQVFACFVIGAGGKGRIFLLRSPRRDFDTRPSVPRIRRGRLCAVRVSRLKLTRRTKEGCRNFAPPYSSRECTWLGLYFFNTQLDEENGDQAGFSIVTRPASTSGSETKASKNPQASRSRPGNRSMTSKPPRTVPQNRC